MVDLSLIYSRRPIEIINDVVSSHIRPFRPGLIDIVVVADTFDPIIMVTSSTFTDNVFRMDGRELYLLSREEDMAVYVGDRLGEYYRSLMTESIPDTIELGSN